MAEANDHVKTLGSAEWRECERIVARFEAAHRRGEAPALADHLPAEGALRRAVLLELVHTDLELRLDAGETVRVEEYLRRFPELGDGGVVVDLAVAEYALRRRREPQLSPDEYPRRFPQVAAKLAARLPAAAEPPTVPPALPTTVVPAPALAPQAGGELQALLRKRLLMLLVVFALYFLAILLLHISYHASSFAASIDFWASAATFLACLGLAAALSSRPRMNLRQLRVVELLLFAVFGARMVLRGYVLFWHQEHIDRVQAWIAAGDGETTRQLLTGLAYRLTAASAMFAVAYGVIVPNTWQRCALVVAAFTVLPMGIWLAGCASRELPMRHWFSFQTVIAFLVVILTAVLSVYGAHRIERSRQEAADARKLGPYQLKRRLGAGGMGEVYLAEHVLLKQPCAVKLIRPERAGDPSTLARFEREVRATARLKHWNTVRVFDYGHAADGTFYYAMEYLPGLTLEELVKRHGPLPLERAVHLLRQACAALAEAHAAGLIHRDIKPANLMVCEWGGLHDVVKVLDFGLVKAVGTGDREAQLTQEGVVAGTPAYLSPEQAGGKRDLGAGSDLYSLGAVAHFLLAGQPPFVRATAMQTVIAHLCDVSPPLGPEVPADLAAVVARCLEKDPGLRFPTARALEQALAACTCAGEWSEEAAARWWQATRLVGSVHPTAGLPNEGS